MAEWYLGLVDGYGDGYGSGSGYGYGYGYGYGDGYGDGYGYGSGSEEIILSQNDAWLAYHFIVPVGDKFQMRHGSKCSIGEHLHEPEISICEKGLHASLTPEDARSFAPSNSVLTRVKVWGRIRLQKDKLVATDRMIVEVVT